MSATAVLSKVKTPPAALRKSAWVVLGYFIAVILWGGVVRATGSGAGCGNHWPLCNGTVLQHSASVETMIEFSHRLTSGLSLLLVIGLLVWTFAGTPRRHLARATAIAAVAFTLIEAILGALLVKLGLTAQSQSPLRAPYLALHLTNTLLLLAMLALTAHLLSRKTGFTRDGIRLVTPFASATGMFLVLIVGVTGSLAALGDTLFPSSSFGAAFANDFSASSEWLIRWRWTHPVFSVLAGGFLIWLLLRAIRQKSKWDNRSLVALVMILLAAQYALGLMDVLLLAPVWLQTLHLLGADVLWASLVVLTARLTMEPIQRS